jgi:outer membrane protein TolC
MQVDLVADAALGGPPRRSGFALPELDRYSWSAGLDVDLPLDRTMERNSYRAAIITEKQANRSAEQQADEIRLDLRESWRNLDRAKRNYEISALGVTLSEKRVEEQELLAELGRAKAQDMVDAQNDLISARNQRTQALVAHTVARLQFWVRMGILYIRDDGQWREMKDTDVPKDL